MDKCSRLVGCHDNVKLLRPGRRQLYFSEGDGGGVIREVVVGDIQPACHNIRLPRYRRVIVLSQLSGSRFRSSYTKQVIMGHTIQRMVISTEAWMYV